MALNLDKNLKLYYSISEVARMFGLNESTLRYWEQEFPYLKPKTKGPGKVRLQACRCEEDHQQQSHGGRPHGRVAGMPHGHKG